MTCDSRRPREGGQQDPYDGGYTLFLKDGKFHYVYNYVAADYFRVASRKKVPKGKVELRFEFEPTGPPDIPNGKGAPGRAQLYINGELTGQAQLPYTIPLTLGLAASACVGRDEGAPVCSDYNGSFEFTGTIERVTIDVSGAHIEDKEAAMRAIMARQ